MSLLFGKKQMVQVKYDPAKKRPVTLDDDGQAILARNPQLIKP